MSDKNFTLQKHTLPCQHIREYPRATAQNEEDTLVFAVNQYTPHDNPYPVPGDVTIIAAHANGVGKELYEPLFDDLYEESKRTGAFKLGNIFIADVAWQGESGVLNEGKLGNDPSWYDHPRDLLHMVNHFRNHIHRPIFGMGHSMGGNQIATLALIHPRLFTALLLLDPVIDRVIADQISTHPAFLSTFRRDVWPSREHAASLFRANRFYQSWDARVLDKWIEHGLRELPTMVYPKYPGSIKDSDPPPAKPVTLTTSKHQEVFTFLRPLFPEDPLEPYRFGDIPPTNTHPDLPESRLPSMAFYRAEPMLTYDRLPHLRPQTFYLFGDTSEVSPPPARQRKLDATGTGWGGNGAVAAGGVEHHVVPQGGHFFPFEKPAHVAQVLAPYLQRKVEQWEAEQAEMARIWQHRDIVERTTFSERFTENMKPLAPPGRDRSKM